MGKAGLGLPGNSNPSSNLSNELTGPQKSNVNGLPHMRAIPPPLALVTDHHEWVSRRIPASSSTLDFLDGFSIDPFSDPTKNHTVTPNLYEDQISGEFDETNDTYIAESPSPLLEQNSSITERPNPQCSPHRRRGPGRPRKGQSSTQFVDNGRPISYSRENRRRQLHNDSALRSRVRLNDAITELWEMIPPQEKALQSCSESVRYFSRAEKVESAIRYFEKLRKCYISGS